MESEGSAPQEEGRLGVILAAMRESADKTLSYFAKTAIFYSVLIIIFIVLLLIADKKEARGFDIGVLILLGLGMLSMWISGLRGLRDPDFKWGKFLNLAWFPLRERLPGLEDAGHWSDAAERSAAAEEAFERRVAEEKEVQAWPNRMLSIVVITIIDLLIWLVWDNLVSAIINQVVAMIVSQVHITLAPKYCLKVKKGEGGGS